jgi:hypothetical protein
MYQPVIPVAWTSEITVRAPVHSQPAVMLSTRSLATAKVGAGFCGSEFPAE